MNIDDILTSEFQKLSESCETQEEYTKFIERWIVIWKKIYENSILVERNNNTNHEINKNIINIISILDKN